MLRTRMAFCCSLSCLKLIPRLTKLACDSSPTGLNSFTSISMHVTFSLRDGLSRHPKLPNRRFLNIGLYTSYSSAEMELVSSWACMNPRVTPACKVNRYVGEPRRSTWTLPTVFFISYSFPKSDVYKRSLKVGAA